MGADTPYPVGASSLASRLDRPAAAVLVTAVLTLLFLILQLSVRDFDASRFVFAGDRFVDAQAAPDGLTVLKDSHGYDGQFYYRVALDPLTERRTDFGIRFDTPYYRHQRILYPLLARGLAWGRADLLPWALIAVNFAGLCAISWLGAAYAQRAGRHALAGLAFSLYGGVLLSLSRDLVEICELALILAGFLCMRMDRSRQAALWLSLAVLAKEPALLVAVAALAARLLGHGKQDARPSWAVVLWPMATFVLWQAWILTHWDVSVLAPAAGKLRRPILAFFELWGRGLGGDHPYPILLCAELALIVAFTVSVAAAARRSAATLIEKIAALLYAILIFTRADGVWSEDWAFLRAGSDFYFTGTMVLLHTQSRVARAWPAISVTCCFLLAIHLLRFRA